MVHSNKNYVINMDLLPKSQALKIRTFTNSGVLNHFVKLDNLLPMTYFDFVAWEKRPQYEMPAFLDKEMIYFSRFSEAFYLFDTEG